MIDYYITEICEKCYDRIDWTFRRNELSSSLPILSHFRTLDKSFLKKNINKKKKFIILPLFSLYLPTTFVVFVRLYAILFLFLFCLRTTFLPDVLFRSPTLGSVADSKFCLVGEKLGIFYAITVLLNFWLWFFVGNPLKNNP